MRATPRQRVWLVRSVQGQGAAPRMRMTPAMAFLQAAKRMLKSTARPLIRLAWGFPDASAAEGRANGRAVVSTIDVYAVAFMQDCLHQSFNTEWLWLSNSLR